MENASPALSADAALLLDTLRNNFGKPIAFTPLWEELKNRGGHWPKAQTETLLSELVKSGLVRRSGKSKAVYWHPMLEPQAQERICAVLSDGPRNQTQMNQLQSKLLPGWPKTQRTALLKQLLQTRRVYRWPKQGNAVFFSTQPPDPQAYLPDLISNWADKLQHLANQFAASGIAPEQIYSLANDLWQQALPAITFHAQVVGSKPEPERSINQTTTSQQNNGLADDEQLLLEGMFQLEPAAAKGALVSVTRLWRLLKDKFPDKQSFDQTALSLAEQNRVALHWHDYPSSLSQSERDELVRDERGNYYIGITLRK
jgi:predicted transcriptional regulator